MRGATVASVGSKQTLQLGRLLIHLIVPRHHFDDETQKAEHSNLCFIGGGLKYKMNLISEGRREMILEKQSDEEAPVLV